MCRLHPSASATESIMRLDQWLWAVRVYKSRTNAADAIKAGHVTINGQAPKPSRDVRVGETIAAAVGHLTRTVKVIALPPSRVGAKLVAQFAEDLTPAEEYAKRREPSFIPPMLRPKGTGRPTKRERRHLDAFEGESADGD
jgi:ribosome-associated heat shock protein Hsp15